MTMLTEAVLKDLEEKAKAATPGPWRVGEDVEGLTKVVGASREVCETSAPLATMREVVEDQSNADFIASANPATMLALVARVRELDDACRRAHSALFLNESMEEATAILEATIAPELVAKKEKP